MRKLVGLLLAVMVHGYAFPGLAQTYLEKQEVPSALNFLKNPGFENGVSAWTRGGGCSTNSSVPLSGLKNGNCTGTGAAETKWEQAPTFAEYRPFVGQTWKASCHVATISSSMQLCGLLDGSETSCIAIDESASLNVAGYKEYAVQVHIPPDQSSSFTAGVRIKTTGSGVFGTRVDSCYLGPWDFVGVTNPSGIVGEVKAMATATCPAGTLSTNGAAVSRSAYSRLFSEIGTTHGQGDGSTTFNVPNYRGRFLRGVAGGQTIDPDRASRTAMATGGNTGDNVGSVQSDQYRSHNHNIRRYNSTDDGSHIDAGAGNGATGFTASELSLIHI